VTRTFKPRWSSGTHSVQIKVEYFKALDNTWGLGVGVSLFSSQISNRLVILDRSWVYIGLNGHKENCCGTGHAYGHSYGSGDIVTMNIDIDKGILEFLTNGVHQGIAYTNVIGPLYPFVGLSGVGKLIISPL